jgi:hypothetical protein
VHLSAWDEELKPGETRFVRNFRVGDAETPAAELSVSGTSDNAAWCRGTPSGSRPASSRGEYGDTYNRRLTVTPGRRADRRRQVVITVTDAAGAKREQSFKLRVK